MPEIFLLSTDVIWNPTTRSSYAGVVDALKQLHASEKNIWIVSSHDQPDWLEPTAPFIKFCHCQPKIRASGKVILQIIAQNQEAGLELADLVVLGAKDTDFQMAVNAQALLLRCDWVSGMSGQILKYGVPLPSPEALTRVANLLETKTPWHFRYECSELCIFALTNAGTHGLQDAETLKLIAELRACLKDGARRGKDGFKIHLLSSLSERLEVGKLKSGLHGQVLIRPTIGPK
jgi:hypothetical protein